MNISLDENAFWLSIWSVIATGIVIIALVIHYNSTKEDLLIAKLIQQGHDKIELACVYKVSDSIKSTCLMLAQERLTKAMTESVQTVTKK